MSNQPKRMLSFYKDAWAFVNQLPSKPTFIMLAGVPSCSREVIAKTMRLLCWELHSTNSINRQFSGRLSEEALLGEFYRRLEFSMDSSKCHILDNNPNLDAAARRRSLKLARQYGYDTHIIAFKQPLTTQLRKRLEPITTTPSVNKRMQRMHKQFYGPDWPKGTEAPLTVARAIDGDFTNFLFQGELPRRIIAEQRERYQPYGYNNFKVEDYLSYH